MSRPLGQLGVFYFAYFGGLGVTLPWLNLYFERAGMTPARIGLLAAIVPLGRILFPVLWAYAADRSGRRGQVTTWLCLLTVAALASFLPAAGFAALLAACLFLSIVDGPRLPLVEATTFDFVGSGRAEYGRLRGWGSLAFILSSASTGWLVGRLTERAILWSAILWAILAFAVSLKLPQALPRRPVNRSSLRAALRRPGLTRFLAGGLLMQASHSAYYAFFTIHLDRSGYSGRAIGALWALGVCAEVVLMFRAGSGRIWNDPARLMGWCAAAAALRWAAIAWSSHPGVLIPAQLLHALTFGAFHIAAINETQRLFPEDLRASGLSVFSGVTYGLGALVATLASGALFERFGAPVTFLASSAMAIAAAVTLLPLRNAAAARGAE